MEFIDYNIAIKLKEKGFPQHWSDQHYILENEYEYDFFEVGAKYPVDVIYDYIPTIAAPTISQVLKWLRESHKIHIEIVACAYGYNIIISKTPPDGTDLYFSHSNDDGPNDAGAWDVYEQAVLAGIEYILENLI